MKKLTILIIIFFSTLFSVAQYQKKKIRTKEDYIHESTNIVFPLTIDKYNRSGIYSFDKKNTNIGVNYQDQKTKRHTGFSIYIYPVGRAIKNRLRNEFIISLQSVSYISKKDLNVQQYPVSYQNSNNKINGFKAEFVVNSINSNLSLFECGNWYFKIRITSNILDSAGFANLDSMILNYFNPTKLAQMAHFNENMEKIEYQNAETFSLNTIEEYNDGNNKKFVFIEKSIDTTLLIFKRTFKCISKKGDDIPSLYRAIKMSAINIGANCFKFNNFIIGNDETMTLILDTYYASDSILNVNFKNCEKNTIYIFGDNEFYYDTFLFKVDDDEKQFNWGEYFKISLNEGEMIKIKKAKSLGGKVKIKWLKDNPSKYFIITGYEISPPLQYIKPDGHKDIYFKTGRIYKFDPNLGHLLSLIFKKQE